MARIRTQSFLTKSADTVAIRSAETTDADPLVSLVRAVMGDNRFTLTEPDEFQVTVAEEAAYIQRFLEHPRNVFLVAEVANTLVGTLTLEVGTRRRISHTAELGMGISSRRRRQGIGEQLVNAALAWAKTAQVERVELSVHSNNLGGIALYRKLGFVHEGTQLKRIKYAADDYVDSFIMAKWLKSNQ